MMRKLLLSSTIIVAASLSTTYAATMITPGQGSLTDVSGKTWIISASGSIEENNQWTPGGGGTSALSIVNGVVYGQDAQSQRWFVLSSNGQDWAPSSAPSTALTPSPVGTVSVTPTGSLTTAAVTTVCSAPTQQAFGILDGVIYDVDQKPWIARGIDVMNFGNNPSASEILAVFPSINFVRLAVYQYDSPEALAPYINDLTGHRIVVELENHNNGAGNAGGGQGVVFTGAALANESAWYASIASYFKSNPWVWFGTNNEPPNDPAAVSVWQGATIDAIRSTGNLAPIMIEVNGWADPASFGSGYLAEVFKAKTGLVADVHMYGWLFNNKTDQGFITQFLASAIAATQRNVVSGGLKIPIIIGEYGPSTMGPSPGDPNGMQVVQGVQASGAGTAAWAWGPGAPGSDSLQSNSGGLSAFGQSVAAHIAAGGSTSASSSTTSSFCGTAAASVAKVSGTATIVAQSTNATGTAQAPDTNASSTVSPVTVATNQATQSAQTDSDTADAIIAKANAALGR